MKQQVFFIHGGSSFSNHDDYLAFLKSMDCDPNRQAPKKWRNRLGEDLGPEYEVIMPEFPSKDNARFAEWSIWFENHFSYLADDLILIGWSQGALFLQKYLAQNDLPFSVKKMILISPPHYYFKSELIGEDGGDFNLGETDNISVISSKVEEIVIVHSKDDFIVSYDHAEQLHEKIPSAQLEVFEDRGHFLQEEFPEIIEIIQKET